MAKAARALIIKDDKILVMHRNKHGTQYYTLVGGRVNDNETLEEGLAREVREETGLEVTASRLVFTEKHPDPYNDQYVFLCEVAPYDKVEIQAYSEEALMNRFDLNTHKPMWAETKSFGHLHFLTSPLQQAIDEGLRKGFPNDPIAL